MESVSFTNNISSTIAFDGVVKIKCDDMGDGDFVKIFEEKAGSSDSTDFDNYDAVLSKDKKSYLSVAYPHGSGIFELKGNYKLQRSSSFDVGYEE